MLRYIPFRSQVCYSLPDKSSSHSNQTQTGANSIPPLDSLGNTQDVEMFDASLSSRDGPATENEMGDPLANISNIFCLLHLYQESGSGGLGLLSFFRGLHKSSAKAIFSPSGENVD